MLSNYKHRHAKLDDGEEKKKNRRDFIIMKKENFNIYKNLSNKQERTRKKTEMTEPMLRLKMFCFYSKR